VFKEGWKEYWVNAFKLFLTDTARYFEGFEVNRVVLEFDLTDPFDFDLKLKRLMYLLCFLGFEYALFGRGGRASVWYFLHCH
jgi:hypothetical protein